MASPGRADVLSAVLGTVPGHLTVVVANGYLAREAFRLRPVEPDFQMLGSMGLASSIGAGMVAQRPDRPVVVVDGDGNVLMGLAALPVVAVAAAGGTLVHVVVDDGAYASTGGQTTLTATGLDLASAALALGYRSAVRVNDLTLVPGEVKRSLGEHGAHLIHLHARTEGEAPSPRVDREPAEIATRVTASYASHAP